MVKIGICDDDEYMRQEIQRVCSGLVSRSGYQADFIQFEGGKAVLSYPVSMDILILDIEMPDMDGIEIKQRLEKMQDETLIIYVTSHVEWMQEAFGKCVFGFVDKSFLEEQLCRVLKSAIQNVQQNVVYVDDVIDSRKILYIQSEHVYSNVFLNDGTEHLVRAAIQELEQELVSVDFVRAHRSYLVNLQWVDRIRRDKLCIMEHCIPVSRSHMKEVKEAFRKYCWSNGRYC